MSADFNHRRTVRARRPHRCDECGRSIRPGEDYERTAAKWEGDFFTNLACTHCAIARDVLNDRDAYYNESYYGGLAECLPDSAFDDPDPVWRARLLRLLVGVRRRWTRRDGRLMPLPEPVTGVGE